MDGEEILAQADALRAQGRLRDAAEQYVRLMEHPTLAARAHLAMGVVNLQAGALDKAEPYLLRALADRELEPEALLCLGQVEERRGDTARAMARYQQCLQIAPPASPARAAAHDRLRGHDRTGPAEPARQEGIRPARQFSRPLTSVYQRGLTGSVLDVDHRRENYMGAISAMNVIDLHVELHDGSGTAAVSIQGTRVLGAIPRKGQVVEIDLDRSRISGPGRLYRTSRLYNHTVQGELRAETSAVGLTGGAKKAYNVVLGLVVLFVLGCLAAAGLIFRGVWDHGSGPRGPEPVSVKGPQPATVTLTVPDLKGVGQSEAEAALRRAGFELGEYTIVFKPGPTRFGTVFGTEPAAGTKVRLTRVLGQDPTPELQVNVSTNSG